MTRTRSEKVLVACAEGRRSCIALVSAFAESGYRATLVADAENVRQCLEEADYDLITAPLGVLRNERSAFERQAQRSSCALLVLGDETVDDLDDIVHASIPIDSPPREMLVAGSVLLEQRNRRRGHGVDLRTHHRERVILCWGPLRLDAGLRSAWFDDRPLALTRLEFRILHTLMAAEGAVVPREELERVVYGHDSVDGGERLVAHIRRIRRKIEADGQPPKFLLTVRGEGFRLASAETS